MRHKTLTSAVVALFALAACRAEVRNEADSGAVDTIGDTTRVTDPADAEITIGTESKRVVIPDVDVTDSSITLGKDTVTVKVPTVRKKPD